MNILLLNPPGKKLYIRDYYCSKVSKAGYIYHPTDLLVLSGILSLENEILVLDCIIEKIHKNEAFEKIKKMNVDLIVSLIGAVSYDEDIDFLKNIKENKKSVRILVSGDCFMDNEDEILKKENWIDGIVVDFTSTDIKEFVRKSEGEFFSITYRNNKGEIIKAKNRKVGEFTIPVPRHDLFIRNKYVYPFVRKLPFATVLTDYGCPFKCSFCIMGTLKYKYRPVENIIEELNFIRNLGIKEIYLTDQSFGVIKERTKDLCMEMKKINPKFGWVCFTRVDITDETMISFMKEAGCHTIIYGVESGSQRILDRYNKNLTLDQIKKSFDLCRKYKIRTVGTFIIGLYGETEEDIKKTIEFVIELNCDYASFNIAVPRARTALRKEMIENGIIDEKFKMMDQSGDKITISCNNFSIPELLKWRDIAIKKFYFRPYYLFKRLFNIRSFDELKINFTEGMAIIKELKQKNV